mmetsp:Transcript_3349/g.13604  ORF Transcript_3349/g.13604 Transcript_3349/m.13604 type:complete len:215 (-) Transcript_3349:874-1518(-)
MIVLQFYRVRLHIVALGSSSSSASVVVFCSPRPSSASRHTSSAPPRRLSRTQLSHTPQSPGQFVHARAQLPRHLRHVHDRLSRRVTLELLGALRVHLAAGLVGARRRRNASIAAVKRRGHRVVQLAPRPLARVQPGVQPVALAPEPRELSLGERPRRALRLLHELQEFLGSTRSIPRARRPALHKVHRLPVPDGPSGGGGSGRDAPPEHHRRLL